MKICHITLLNPAVHSRIFYKEAVSQQGHGHRVTVVGQDEALHPYELEGVRVVPVEPFHRMGRTRLKAREKVFALALQAKADVYQVHTPELLPVAAELKQRTGARIIYDMHEDYALNQRYAGIWSWPLSVAFSWYARRLEKQYEDVLDGVIYAEKCYEGILDLPKEKQVTVLNKFLPPAEMPEAEPDDGMPVLTYTGTIAGAWGVFNSIELWKALNRHLPVKLIIAGHTHHRRLINRIYEKVPSNLQDKFELHGGNTFLPHREILRVSLSGTAGLALYANEPWLTNRFQTKFYEHMGLGKPIVFTKCENWEKENARLHFGKAFDLKSADGQIGELAAWLQDPPVISIPEKEWHWKYEEQKLIDFYEKLK